MDPPFGHKKDCIPLTIKVRLNGKYRNTGFVVNFINDVSNSNNTNLNSEINSIKSKQVKFDEFDHPNLYSSNYIN